MKKAKVFRIALSALFAALLAVMAFTPLGYIPTGAFNITLMFLPVNAALIRQVHLPIPLHNPR